MHGGSSHERFTEVFEKEHDALFRYCFWRTMNRERALELTQEAFARLWADMGRGKEVPNPQAYLFLVAKRLVIDWYRRKKSLSLDRAAEESDERIREPGDANLAAEQMEAASDGRRALEKLERIPEAYREPLYLRFVEDLPPREIAEILGLKVNVVSVRITRGLEALRKELGLDKHNG